MTWNEGRLGDLVTLRSGGTPSKVRSSYWNGDIPWLSSKDLTTPRIYDAPLKVTDDAVGNGTRLMPANTVMFVVRGMSLATEFRVSITRRPCAFNQDLKAVDCGSRILPDFLYYSLFAEREKIRGLAGQASHGTKKLETQDVENIKVKLPSISVQDRVIRVASLYDDLIENNERRIAFLEEAARLLYREWFVHFRFPGHEHVKGIKGVPQGWARVRIEDMCSFLGRGISPTYDDDGESVVVNQKCIRNRLLTLEQARRQRKEYKSEKALRYLDVLINSTGTGTLGRVAQCWFHPTATTCDSHVTVARPNESVNALWFGYALLGLESLFEGMGEGATNQKELSRSRIADVRVTAPPRKLQEHFGTFAADTARQIRILQEQNDKLVEVRDLLLPRLMNGEIAV